MLVSGSILRPKLMLPLPDRLNDGIRDDAEIRWSAFAFSVDSICSRLVWAWSRAYIRQSLSVIAAEAQNDVREIRDIISLRFMRAKLGWFRLRWKGNYGNRAF